MGISCLLLGLFPGFTSFQRIFYIKDTYVFLITYLLFFIFFVLSSLAFIVMSFRNKVYTKSSSSIIIFGIYLLITGALSLNAYVFTDFVITDNGYEVPFNVLMYIIDLLLILPLYGVFDYYLIKYVAKKIR